MRSPPSIEASVPSFFRNSETRGQTGNSGKDGTFSDIYLTRLVWLIMIGDFQGRETSRLSPSVHSPCRWLVFKRSVTHFVQEDDESMKPPSNVKTPAQYIASLPAC